MMREREDEETLFDQETLLSTGSLKFAGRSDWCRKFTKTIVLSGAFFALGLCIAIPGPTLLDLGARVNTDTEHMSLIFTARSLGYLIGSVIGGFLFDHFDQQILLFYSLFLTAIATTVAPWCVSLSALAIMISFQGISMGVLDTGGNVFCIKIWGKKSGPYMQVVHFAFGMGAFVAPLLARPFLINQDLLAATNQTIPTNGLSLLTKGPHASLLRAEFENPHDRYLRDLTANLNVSDQSLNSSTTMIPLSNEASAFNNSVSTTTTQATEKPIKPKHINSSDFKKNHAGGENLKDVNKGSVIRDPGDPSPTTPISATSQGVSNLTSRGNMSANGTGAGQNETDILGLSTTISPSSSASASASASDLMVSPVITTPSTTSTTTTPPPTTTTSSTTTSSTSTTTTTTTTTTPPTPAPNIPPSATVKPSSVAPAESTPLTTTPTAETTNVNGSQTESTVSVTTERAKKPATLGSQVGSALKLLVNMSKIQFAYLIIGVLLILIAFMFLVLYCQDRNRPSIFTRDEEHDGSYGKESQGYRITMLVILFFFFFIYVGMEVTFGGLLSTFSYEKMHWNKPKSAVLTSIFWGSLAAGRGFAIFIARCFKPPCMLVTDLVLLIIGSVILCFGIGNIPYNLWIGTLIIGFGMSSIFPTGVSWADQYFPLTGKSTAVFVVGSALGEMLIPFLTGLLYEKKEKMMLMYMMLALGILLGAIYIVMQCFATRRRKVSATARNGFVPLKDDENISMDTLEQNFEGSGLLETSRHRPARKHPKPANMELEYSRLVDIDD
ncbi:sodium-dependent glucose transporter 1A-like [Haliotis cracherodii]|uniref:sodium-dependent glucose transporter 1A-like n=1 Tax=Haliotis cracherodii TaxID=6455 RepID=UPI0039ED3749